MKSICVKYLPPSATKGARMKAYAEGVKPIIEGFDYEDEEKQAFRLASQLAARQGWGKLHPVSGSVNGVWVFVFQQDGASDTAYFRLEVLKDAVIRAYRERKTESLTLHRNNWKREHSAGQATALAYVAGYLGLTMQELEGETK